jgi:hypothetical protein
MHVNTTKETKKLCVVKTESELTKSLDCRKKMISHVKIMQR